MSDAALTIAALLVLALALLLAFDQFVREIPIVRKYRKHIAGALAAIALTIAALLTFRRKSTHDDAPEPSKPPQFDDTEERKTDAQADDTDLSAAATDRDVADLDRAADDRDDDLDDLRARLDKL